MDTENHTMFQHRVVRYVAKGFLHLFDIGGSIGNRQHIDVGIGSVGGPGDTPEEDQPIDGIEISISYPFDEIIDGHGMG